jgi:hypothetical protein
MIDYEGIVSDIGARIGRQVEAGPMEGDNGLIIKAFPWGHLPSPRSKVHVEATPEKEKGNGYSVHLDFLENYTDQRATPEQRLARERLIDELEARLDAASLIIGRAFNIDPRQKRHLIVEQEDVILCDEWGRDAKIAELIAHYITAFTPAVVAAANS